MQQKDNNRYAIIIIGILFFVFGFVTWLNGTLIPFLKLACQLDNDIQAFFVTFAFYMAYFFLALSETQRLAAGKTADVDQTNQHWKLAIENFRKAKNLEAGLAQEIEGFLHKADADHNGSLNSAELASIIRSRLPKQ